MPRFIVLKKFVWYSFFKMTMKEAGVPTIPGSEGIIDSFEKAKKIAKKIGYPVMIKATAGGGGKGMRAVWSEEGFLDLWESAKQEAFASFGNDGMYMEKLVDIIKFYLVV